MANPTDVTELMTTQEAAAFLEVTREAVSKMVRAGRLRPVRRVGAFGSSRQGAMLFSRSDVERLATQRRTSPPQGDSTGVSAPSPVGSPCGGEVLQAAVRATA